MSFDGYDRSVAAGFLWLHKERGLRYHALRYPGSALHESGKVGKMSMVPNTTDAPFDDADAEANTPIRWIAEIDGGAAGAIDRTPRGEYRATDSQGRKVGTYRTLAEAREQLGEKHDSTTLQRMDQSRVLQISGLVALLATVVIAILGLLLLLAH